MTPYAVTWSSKASESQALAYLEDVTEKLERQRHDLSPDNPAVSATLFDFISTLKHWFEIGFGGHLPDVAQFKRVAQRLPELCAQAEAAMEVWWCKRILKSKESAATLRSFWYWQDYIALTKAECSFIKDSETITFLGSGALPLTAIIIGARVGKSCCICVDNDKEACELSECLIRKLGLQNHIAIDRANAETYTPKHSSDTVICASLLNWTGDYATLIASKAQRLLVRDVEGVFRFCYQTAKLPPPPFYPVQQTANHRSRVNITRLYVRQQPE